jgi:hypothetical protein
MTPLAPARRALLATLCALALPYLAACDDASPAPDLAPDVVADTAQDLPPEASPPTDWSAKAVRVELLTEQTLTGDLSDGAVIDLGWADEPTVNCWTFSDQPRFAGAQVLYALTVPLAKTKRLALTLTPAPGADLNLYAVSQPATSYYLPPDLPAASGCLRSDTAPAGAAETLTLQNITGAQNWWFAVAGPAGVTAGSYTLRIEQSAIQN